MANGFAIILRTSIIYDIHVVVERSLRAVGKFVQNKYTELEKLSASQLTDKIFSGRLQEGGVIAKGGR